MPLAPDFHTADMVRALPDDGNRHELVWGELLVTPAPSSVHQRLVGRILRALADHCDRSGAVEAMLGPADISWSDDTLVQPDVFVVPKHEARARDWASKRTLLLVAEVLSPGTSRHDRFAKRRLYQERGVPVVWLVDPERRVVEVWTPDAAFPVTESARIEWRPGPAGAPMVLDLAALFADD